jgi:hypothetical protein
MIALARDLALGVFWLLPVVIVGGLGLGLALTSGSKAKKRLIQLVKVRTLGINEGGGLLFSFDELVAVRDAGYARAIELKLDGTHRARDVLNALAYDRDKRIGGSATLRGVLIGTVGDDKWEDVLTAADNVPAYMPERAPGFNQGEWGALKRRIDEFLRERGVL